jgi:hypothetical protein
MNFFKQMNRRAVAATAVSAGLLVPLGILGAPALAGSSSSSNAYQYQYKVAVCHKTHSKKHPWHAISVGAPAVKAHLKHGDFLVTPTTPCPPVAPAAGAAPTTSATHGKSGDHGNNGNNGNHGNNGNNGNNGKGHGK